MVCDPLLARAVDSCATPGTERSEELNEQGGLLAEGTGQERRHLTGRGTGEGREGQEQQNSAGPPDGLVCPGCTRSGLRGGVRFMSEDAQTTPCSPGPQAESEGGEQAVCAPQVVPDDHARKAPTDGSAVGRTFHTSLGVVVDTCIWRRQGDANLEGAVYGDRAAGGGEF